MGPTKSLYLPICHWKLSLNFWKPHFLFSIFIILTQIFEFWVMFNQAKQDFFSGTHEFWTLNYENWVISLSFVGFQTAFFFHSYFSSSFKILVFFFFNCLVFFFFIFYFINMLSFGKLFQMVVLMWYLWWASSKYKQQQFKPQINLMYMFYNYYCIWKQIVHSLNCSLV